MIQILLISSLIICFCSLNWCGPLLKTIYDQIGIKTCLMESLVKKRMLSEDPLIFERIPFLKDQFGWGNGYVVIPIWHPLFKDSSFNPSIHWGLSWYDLVSTCGWDQYEGLTAEDSNKWIIGFDTNHAWDNTERWPKEAVQAEANRLLQQVINY